MNTDSLSFALNEVTTIIKTLNKKQYKSQLTQLQKLVSHYGVECERQIYRILFQLITSTSDQQRVGLLQQVFVDLNLFDRPNWTTLLDSAIKGVATLDVFEVAKALRLTDIQRAALLVAVSEQTKQCPGDCDQLEQLNCDINNLNELTHYVLVQSSFDNKKLFERLRQDLKVSSETVDSRVKLVHLPFSEEAVDRNDQMDTSSLTANAVGLNDDQIASMLVNESGVPLTAEVFRPFNVTPKLCAKVLFAICENASARSNEPGQSQRSEEIDNFANICREIMSSASPLTEIIQEIDSEGFTPSSNKIFGQKVFGKNNQSFQRFWQFCTNLCTTDKQGLSLLGHAFFGGIWSKNIEFQFGFIVNCVKMQLISKLLSSSGGSEGTIEQIVPHLDMLKCQPDFEGTPELNTWKCQRLYQILIDLAAVNYHSINSIFYSQIVEIFKWPIQHCPDLVAFGLLACNNTQSMAKNEILGLTVPAFLGNHPNAAIILHTIWNNNEIQSPSTSVNQWAKQVLLQAMCDYYMKSPADEQQQRLSRILDVAQDLKALSLLLNGSCYPFVIDLACLASRREYLKLDKWLMDKIESNGENFINACVMFLTRRCQALLGGSNAIESSSNIGMLSNLPPETLATVLSCLQQILPSNSSSPNSLNVTISQELNETILTMVGNSSRFLTKVPRQPPPGVLPNPATRTLPSNQTPIGDLGLNNLTINTDSPLPSAPPPNNFNSNATRPSFNLQNLAPQPPTSTTGQSILPQTRGIHEVVGALSSIFPEMQHNVSIDIEEEADTYFQRIYNHLQPNSLSIDEVLEMLRRFQDSPIKREREVFTCMIRNLFKEYGFFPQYPERELMITAQLFGGIIQMGLVKYMALVVALRYVLEALRKPPNSKMYFFGIHALKRFKTKLKDYPLYCQHLASIPHFSSFPSDLIEYIECGAQSQEPSLRNNLAAPGHQLLGDNSSAPGSVSTTNQMSLANSLSGFGVTTQNTIGSTITNQTTVQTGTRSNQSTSASSIPNNTTSSIAVSTSSTRPSIANATNIDTLLAADDTMYSVPPENLQDKVAFIINNLSQVNLPHKTEEFKELIGKDDQYMGWIAQYFVMKRASIEPNFHSLYANFLDMLKLNDLVRMILKETHRNIKVLLRSDKEVANFSDRSLLKNLGHWLGMLTLAKSKPILAIDLDLKNLLIEAYHKGIHELLYVVPFLAKILESCAKSKVFKPPNPWTMGIIKVLVELHQEPNLKLNLKFEVEVLCKALNLELNHYVGKSNILKDNDYFTKIDPQLGSLVKPPLLTNETLQPPQPPSPGLTNQLTTSIPTNPSGPRLFDYNEINISSIAGLSQHILIQPNLQLLNMNTSLKNFVRPAIERAVQEWMNPVIERSMKISLTTVEQIIKKDFALDPEEQHLASAAHNLMRNLIAGMAMITCKDPLFASITSALKTAFASKCPTVNKELIEATAHSIAQDNIDLACCFIQKTAIEKSLAELDRKLKLEYEIRRTARSEGRRYCDATVLTYQAERMPEAIRLKVGPVTMQQMNVYDELGKNVPGFVSPVLVSITGNSNATTPPAIGGMPPNFGKSMPPIGVLGPGLSDPGTGPNPDQALIQIYEKLMAELETLLHQFVQAMLPNHLIDTIRSIAENLILARQNPRDIVYALNLIQKVLDAISELLITSDGLMDMTPIARARDIYLVILKMLCDPRAFTHQWTTKQITRIILDRHLSNSASTMNLPDELLETLMRAQLFNFQLMDANLAHLIDNSSSIGLQFFVQFIKIYGHHCSENDFPNVIESLLRLSKSISSTNMQLFNEIQQVIDILRGQNGGNTDPMQGMLPPMGPSREFDADPPGLLEKTERLLREWIQLYHSTANTSKIFQFYVQQMNLQGILKTDDLITRFFRLSTEMCVELCYRILNSPGNANIIDIRTKCFHTLDAFTHLIVMLVKHSGSSSAQTGAASETTAKLNLLNKVLTIIAGVASQDQDLRQAEFQHLPYYRIFVLLFMELVLGPANFGLPGSVLLQHGQMPINLSTSQMDPLYESVQYQVLSAFCSTLHSLRPSKTPSFAFAWLDFISHRTFMEKCLYSGSNSGAPTKGWPMYAQLIVDLIKFEAPFLRNVELPQSMDSLYKGTLKVFLVLLHDFPEFLCEYCYNLCDVIPCNAIQLRNLVLSAFPRNMRLPDPFTPNLKIDSLPEITQSPKGTSSFSALNGQSFKKDLDSYLRSRSPVTFLSDLRGYLQYGPSQAQTESNHYNIPLMNALVLYVGQTAIQTISSKNINISSIAHSSHMDIFQNLAVALDTEGRYLFLNAIANQLRYPNSHTHYFSCTLLYLFAESNTEAIQEQITRVLLERLIVNRPHPWGLLVTFIELIKNPTFKFWNHDFVRCAPEIEKLFDSVARSCNSTNCRTPSTGPASSDTVLVSTANQSNA